jgi:hypothetical protein
MSFAYKHHNKLQKRDSSGEHLHFISSDHRFLPKARYAIAIKPVRERIPSNPGVPYGALALVAFAVAFDTLAEAIVAGAAADATETALADAFAPEDAFIGDDAFILEVLFAMLLAP